nr:hypothetical protein [Tanacetum cinerariifolium]
MKEKGDECIFVGYSTQSRAYRVFNKRTRVIMESIHVNFDELPQMASVQNSSDPAPTRQKMASAHNSSDPAPTCQTMASVQIRYDPVPECQTMALEHGSLSPGRKCQENVSHGDKTGTMSNELDLLFSPMFDELLNGSSKVVSKSFAVSAADAPNQRQQLITPLNNHTTPAPTCHTPLITPSIISSENINQAEPHAENDEVADDEFINIFSTPVQDKGETSSRHVDSSNMHTFYQRCPSEQRWTKDHPLEQVIRNHSQSVRTRRQLESDTEMLSKIKMMSKSFESVQKHAINLELELQQCKEKVKNDMYFKVNKSKDFCKEREQYFEIQDLKSQLQDKGIVISELKKLIEKLKGKYVNTKFEKSSVIRQPNSFKSQRPSVLGKPTTFSNSFISKDFSKSTSVTQNNVSNDFSKPVTAQTLPTNKMPCLKNTNVLAPEMYKLYTDHTQARTSKMPQDSKKTNKRVSFSIAVILTTSVSRPQLKSNPQGDRVMHNNSQGKKKEVEDHRRSVKLSKNKTSVTACNDSLNAKTLNVKSVFAMCDKCVLIDKHDMCVLKYVAKPLKETVASESKKKPINFTRKLYESVTHSDCHIHRRLWVLKAHDRKSQYGDLIQGTVTIKRVYYVEGLNHKLFSVGQFCDADLEVAFRKSTCFIRDLKGDDLLTGSRGTDLYLITLQDTNCSNPICLMAKATSSQAWLWHRRLSYLNFDTINLLSKNDIVVGLPKLKFVKDHRCSSCKLGKAKQKLVQRGLQAQVRVVRTDKGTVFNKRTRMILESIHVNFDKLPQMASVHISSDPAPECQTMALELAVSKSSAVTTADESIQRQQHQITPLNNHTTPAPTCQIQSIAPSVISSKNINQPELNAENDQVADDEFFNIFSTLVQDQRETSDRHVDSSNMHTFYQRYPSKHRWTKDHPLEQVIGNPSQSVRTRRQLESDAEICMFALTVSRTEPKNIKEAMVDSAWIESMQDELHQFDRLDVWELVDRHLCTNVINLKWLWKNKRDEENTVIRNKSRLVAKGYAQKEGVDFEESFAPVARENFTSLID